MSHLDNDRREIFRNLYYPERVRGLDIDRWVDYYADAGATSVCMDIKSQAYVYYDSKLAPKDPVLGTRDLAAELAAAARRRGIKWSAYIAPSEFECLPEAKRRDWHIRFEDGKRTMRYRGRRLPVRSVFCWNSPYTDLFLSILEEIAGRYRPDGFYLDGVAFPCYGEKIACYCPRCRERFQREFGMPLPTVRDLDAPAWPLFLQARRKWNAELAETIARRVRAIDPGISLVVNAVFGYHGWPCSMSPAAAKHFDFLCFEIPPGLLHRDARPPGFSVADNFFWKSAILRGLQQGRPGEYFTVFGPMTRPEEIRFGVDLVSAAGARLSVAGRRADMSAALARIKDMEPCLSGIVPDPQIGIHFSENTHVAYYKSHIGVRDPDESALKDPFFNEIRGLFKAALDARRPAELLMDEDLQQGDFRGARLLVLPNSAVLPMGFESVLLPFLEGGGSALATRATGTFDEAGRPASDEPICKGSGLKILGPIRTRRPWVLSREGGKLRFEDPVPPVPAQYLCFKDGPLSEWLGLELAAHHRSLPEPMEEREIQQLRQDEHSVHWPYETLRIVAGASWTVLATIRYLDEESGGWMESPAILSRPVGAGTLIYAASSLAMGPLPYAAYRGLVARLVDVAIGRNPVRIDAPASVKVTFWKQGGRRLIHLVNELSDQASEWEVEARIPVPVKIVIPRSVCRAVEVPVGGAACAVTRDDKAFTVSCPALSDRLVLACC